MKKKLFVLREESSSGPARVEYYDNEKKFKNGSHSKRSIILKTCFNINKKSDSKHKFAIALYTKDDCFSMVCDNEEEQKAWLTAMLEIQNNNMEEGQSPRPLFGKLLYSFLFFFYFCFIIHIYEHVCMNFFFLHFCTYLMLIF